MNMCILTLNFDRGTGSASRGLEHGITHFGHPLTSPNLLSTFVTPSCGVASLQHAASAIQQADASAFLLLPEGGDD